MEIIYIIFGITILGLLSFLVYQNLFEKKDTTNNEKIEILENEKISLLQEKLILKAELDQKTTNYGKLQNELEQVRSEKDQRVGENKKLYIQTKDLQNDLKHLQEESSVIKKKLANFNAQDLQKEAVFSEKIKKLEHAQKSLEDEKTRIRREDEEEQIQIQEQKTKIWNEHEKIVISRLKESCQKPEIGFKFFENTNLPSDFTGSFKPDFLVEFLGQYIYFDAKFSAQKDPNSYFSLEKLSKISKKCKTHKIYSTIFFVVPENRISEIRKFSFRNNDFSFFIISVSAIEPILSNFKKITEYENLEKFDPEDREKIVTLIANYDKHISFQNATNILLTKESIGLMNSKATLPNKFQTEIDIRKQSMRNLKLKESEIKKLSQNLEEQTNEVTKLTSPQIAIKEMDLKSAQNSLRI